MSLQAPNLDDRRFQDLVDDAKRLVQQRCPEWTDHNVSDPGITLIELFAWLTEMQIFRLSQVPRLHYLKFLELVGIADQAREDDRRENETVLEPLLGSQAADDRDSFAGHGTILTRRRRHRERIQPRVLWRAGQRLAGAG